jgi:hypothetical protein
MAVPPFGFLVRERIAGLLMLLTGLLSLTLLIASPERLVSHGVLQPSRIWLMLQSLLVILGALGAFARILGAVTLGVFSGLVPTSVASLTFLPSLGVLIFCGLRPLAFRRFNQPFERLLRRDPER